MDLHRSGAHDRSKNTQKTAQTDADHPVHCPPLPEHPKTFTQRKKHRRACRSRTATPGASETPTDQLSFAVVTPPAPRKRQTLLPFISKGNTPVPPSMHNDDSCVVLPVSSGTPNRSVYRAESVPGKDWSTDSFEAQLRRCLRHQQRFVCRTHGLPALEVLEHVCHSLEEVRTAHPPTFQLRETYLHAPAQASWFVGLLDHQCEVLLEVAERYASSGTESTGTGKARGAVKACGSVAMKLLCLCQRLVRATQRQQRHQDQHSGLSSGVSFPYPILMLLLSVLRLKAVRHLSAVSCLSPTDSGEWRPDGILCSPLRKMILLEEACEAAMDLISALKVVVAWKPVDLVTVGPAALSATLSMLEVVAWLRVRDEDYLRLSLLQMTVETLKLWRGVSGQPLWVPSSLPPLLLSVAAKGVHGDGRSSAEVLLETLQVEPVANNATRQPQRQRQTPPEATWPLNCVALGYSLRRVWSVASVDQHFVRDGFLMSRLKTLSAKERAPLYPIEHQMLWR